jgi:hypothetical protein
MKIVVLLTFHITYIFYTEYLNGQNSLFIVKFQIL